MPRPSRPRCACAYRSVSSRAGDYTRRRVIATGPCARGHAVRSAMSSDARRATIRTLGPADLDGALASNDAVGWPDRRVLFDFYGARDDSALFVADAGGEIAGTAGATIFPGSPPPGWGHGIVVRPEPH